MIHAAARAARAAPATREAVFAAVFILLSLNAAMTLVMDAVRGEGIVAAAFGLFGVSAILWVAGAAAVDLLVGRNVADAATTGHPMDTPVLAIAVVAAIVPVPAMAGAMLTLIAVWGAFTSPRGSALRRASIIFGAITASLLWGRLLLALLSGPLLAIEGLLVGLTGADGAGNAIAFRGGGDFVIAPGCSSMQGVSLAIVLWVAVMQYFDLHAGRRAAAALILAILGAMLSNVLRLGAIARWPQHFDLLHTGWGAAAFGWFGLALIVAAIWSGLRRDIATRG